MMISVPTLSRGRSSGSKKKTNSTVAKIPRSDSNDSTGKRRSSAGKSSKRSPVRRCDSNTSRASVGAKQKRSSDSRSPSRHSKRGSYKKTKGFNEDISHFLTLAIQDSPILSQAPQPFVNYYYPDDVIKGGKFLAGEFFDLIKINYLPSSNDDSFQSSLDDSFAADPYAQHPVALEEIPNGSGHSSYGGGRKSLNADSGHSSFGGGGKSLIGADSAHNKSISSLDHGRIYVVKQISHKHSREKQIIQQATLRLVLEAKYLARLNHPNIIQAKGLTVGEEEPLLDGGTSNFFFMLEKHVETLEERLDRWKREPPEDSNATTPFDLGSRNNQRKMNYAVALAEALKYLHDRNLVVLNLRPETIGFLSDGTIQIRDLSCCREMEQFHRTQTDGPLGFDCDLKVKGDHSSQMVAAKSNFLVLEASVDGLPRPRYVAPEAIMEHTYTPAADTYSWAHVVFELLTLSKPYALYKLGQLLTKVCLEGSRPNLSVYKFPQPLESLLQISWRKSYSKRPSMKALLEAIPLLMQMSSGGRGVTNPSA